MPREFIITMTAANRVGILSAATRAMAELGGDLREASQTVVRGFFTMIFSAEFPDQLDQQVIRDHLQDACRSFHTEVGVNEVPAGTGRPEARDVPPVRLHVLRLGGDNQPGVLRELSGLISMSRIDITGMHAVRVRGGRGFEMIMKIAIPADTDTEKLLRDLNEAGRSFNITADLSDDG